MSEGSKLKHLTLLGVILIAATSVAGCFGSSPSNEPQDITLDGAGATFPAPLYDQWQATYTASVNTHVMINYNAVGSGAGITQITANQVDFAGSDAPMNPTEFAAAPGILHIPSTLGAILPIYKLPGYSGGSLNFTASVLAKIYTGDITAWNDSALVTLNPGLASIGHAITPVHRSDGSGTSFVFTSYLHKAAPTDWPEAGAKNWPNNVGIGGQGNAGVASAVDQNDYSLGYVELSYAKSNPNLNMGKVANKDGFFLLANESNTAAAAAGLSTLPAGDASWSNVDILNEPGANAYPIASMTYLLVYKTQSDAAKGEALANFIWWAIHNDAQQFAGGLGYASLPLSVIYHNENTTDMIKDSSGNKLRSVTGLGYPPQNNGGGGGGGGTVTLDGAGATFPAPLYDIWQGTYTANVDANVHINYGGGGSGAGITQITARQVDWAGSDAPMNAMEFAAAPGILHIPSTLGAVIPIYNIPMYSGGPLNFTGVTLANIYNGNITTWDDPALVADNPDLATVTQDITPVHRSDGSGTTFVFTSYLHKVAPDNWSTAGAKNWPNNIGIGGSGNAGVSSAVQQSDYSIGYVELSYATSQGAALNYGHVKSHDGVFLEATADSTAAAAAGLSTLPAGDAAWTDVEILDQPGANAYPIASMTYLLVYKVQVDHAKGVALVNFLWWAEHDGQSFCADNGYAPLPASVVTHNEQTINSIVDASGNQLHM